MSTTNDSLQNFNKLKASADFCLECGDLLNLPLFSEHLECPKCGFKINLLDYPFEEIVTTKVFTEKKVWLEKYSEKTKKGMNSIDVEEEKNPSRPIIDFECPTPKCKSTKAYYSAMQMRSADEGQTIIYECVKCGHTEALNS